MIYSLKHYPVDTSNISLIRESLKVNDKIYFVPTYVIRLLEDYGKENNSILTPIIIDNYFAIVEILIDAQLSYYKTVSSRRLNKFKSYKFILNLLTPDFIVFVRKYSTKKNRCNEYMLNLNTDLWSFVFIEENGIKNTLKKSIEICIGEEHPCNNPYYMSALQESEIDVFSAIISEIEKYKKEEGGIGEQSLKIKKAITKILSFNKHRFIKKGKDVDRVFNSFSSLSKVARKHVTLNQKTFTEIDISNCQPLLLLILLKKNGLSPDANYVNDVLNGVVYESMMAKADELGYDKEEITSYDEVNKKVITEEFCFSKREDMKILSYRSVFFKLKNDTKSYTAFVFKQLYPMVYDALKNNFAFKGGRNLAFHLQNLEAEIILNIIPECPYYTVHDSISIIDDSKTETVKELIQNRICEYLDMNAKIALKVTPHINNLVETVNSTSKKGMLTSPIFIKSKYNGHFGKQIKFEKFKTMVGKHTQSEIVMELNISSKTYLRYIAECNKEQLVPV